MFRSIALPAAFAVLLRSMGKDLGTSEHVQLRWPTSFSLLLPYHVV